MEILEEALLVLILGRAFVRWHAVCVWSATTRIEDRGGLVETTVLDELVSVISNPTSGILTMRGKLVSA